jgi:hypothetical protein
MPLTSRVHVITNRNLLEIWSADKDFEHGESLERALQAGAERRVTVRRQPEFSGLGTHRTVLPLALIRTALRLKYQYGLLVQLHELPPPLISLSKAYRNRDQG